MATNLSGAITDTDNIIYPTNDDVLTGERPYRVVIESEVLHVRAAEFIGSASEATRWTVDRGQEGTTAASHAAGTAVTAAGAYGAGGGGGVTVDNQSDPPAEVTTLIAPGATISGDEADLSTAEGLQRIRIVEKTITLADQVALRGDGVVVTALTPGQWIFDAWIQVLTEFNSFAGAVSIILEIATPLPANNGVADFEVTGSVESVDGDLEQRDSAASGPDLFFSASAQSITRSKVRVVPARVINAVNLTASVFYTDRETDVLTDGEARIVVMLLEPAA